MIKKKTGLAIVLMISALMPQAVKADEVYKDNHVRFTLIDEGNTISANTAALYTVAFSGSNSYKAVSGMKVQDSHENAKTITAMVWKTTKGETFELKSVE